MTIIHRDTERKKKITLTTIIPKTHFYLHVGLKRGMTIIKCCKMGKHFYKKLLKNYCNKAEL